MINYKGFKARCQGFSHKEAGTICQDTADYFCNEEHAICVVSDGHGSEKYFRSNIGSEKAVEVSKKAIASFISIQSDFKKSTNLENADSILSNDNHKKLLKDLSGYIVNQWTTEISSHWKNNPINDNEQILYSKYFNDKDINIAKIYGTTLIIGVITKCFSFVIHIGDGNVCVIDQNKKKFFSKTFDENQYAGQTNSLSSSDCLKLFHFYYTEEALKAIVVSTDGVVDSYGGNNGKDFLKFCEKLVNLHIENYDQAEGFLNDWLPKLSEKGSRDDMSVAGVFFLPEKIVSVKNNKPEPELKTESDNLVAGKITNEKHNKTNPENA